VINARKNGKANKTNNQQTRVLWPCRGYENVCGAQTSQFKCYISWELLKALEALVIRNRGRIPGFHKVIEEVLEGLTGFVK